MRAERDGSGGEGRLEGRRRGDRAGGGEGHPQGDGCGVEQDPRWGAAAPKAFKELIEVSRKNISKG